MEHRVNDNQQQTTAVNATDTYPGQRWLVEERDACGVGFIANQKGTPTHELVYPL